MKTIIIKSSLRKLLATMLIPIVFSLFMFYYAGISIYTIVVSFIVVTFFIVVNTSRFVRTTCTEKSILIQKPLNIFSHEILLSLDNISSVELRGYKGPFFKFNLTNGKFLSINFMPLENKGVELFSEFLQVHSIKVMSF